MQLTIIQRSDQSTRICYLQISVYYQSRLNRKSCVDEVTAYLIVHENLKIAYHRTIKLHSLLYALGLTTCTHVHVIIVAFQWP